MPLERLARSRSGFNHIALQCGKLQQEVNLDEEIAFRLVNDSNSESIERKAPPSIRKPTCYKSYRDSHSVFLRDYGQLFGTDFFITSATGKNYYREEIPRGPFILVASLRRGKLDQQLQSTIIRYYSKICAKKARKFPEKVTRHQAFRRGIRIGRARLEKRKTVRSRETEIGPSPHSAAQRRYCARAPVRKMHARRNIARHSDNVQPCRLRCDGANNNL